MTPAEEHRRVAGVFTDRVLGTTDWDAPAPVEGWKARDVVRHLVEWFPSFLESGAGVQLERGPSVDEDPVAAWQVHSDAVQRLLDDPATATKVLTNPHIGEVPLDEAVDRFYTSDVFMHTWDLARATGQDETLDADKCAGCSPAWSRSRTCCVPAGSTARGWRCPRTPTYRRACSDSSAGIRCP